MTAFAEIGHGALACALVLSAIASIIPIVGWKTNDTRLMQTADNLALVQFGLVAISFAALVYSFVVSDFSVKLVWENSHSVQPLIYKITGSWGNHEGSILLWSLILVFFSALIAAFGQKLPLELRSIVIAVQSSVSFAFLLFTFVTSNPFERLPIPPIEGQNLNPVLQDLGLAVHPPLLYIGYVGFSVTFSFAIAALITGTVDRAWAKWVRPWTLTAWMFLTLGIAMGSYWAYYELGWGGFWFWDPVENASLLPWLVGTALLHSAIVVEKRDTLKIWTVLLAILTFSFSLLGTFLVRSGVLTSVHSFATDPTRGVFILAILIIFVGGSLTLFALRAESLSSKGLFAPISREGGIVLNNIFLVCIAGTVLIGTLYPLLYEAVSGQKISVGAPFFNMTATPLGIALCLLVPIGPYMTWKRADMLVIAQRLVTISAVALVLGFIITAFLDPKISLAPLGLAIGFWVVFAALWEPLWRAKFGSIKLKDSFRRLINLPTSLIGGSLAHAGAGISMIGLVTVSAYQTETIEIMNPGDVLPVGNYEVSFAQSQPKQGPNYVADTAVFTYAKKGKTLGVLQSEKRLYEERQSPTTEAGIATRGISQIYVTAAEFRNDGSILVRMYWKPLVILIWLGSVVMFIGGAMSLFDRRFRIGAPTRLKPSTATTS